MKTFNIIMAFVFVAFAVLHLQIEMKPLNSLVGYGILIVILLLGNYWLRRYLRFSQQPVKATSRKRPLSYFLFWLFLLGGLMIMAIMLYMGSGVSLTTQKLLACLLCVSIFLMLVAGTIFERHHFQSSAVFSEARPLGITINPRHFLGRIIYISIFILVVVIFVIILIFGPTS